MAVRQSLSRKSAKNEDRDFTAEAQRGKRTLRKTEREEQKGTQHEGTKAQRSEEKEMRGKSLSLSLSLSKRRERANSLLPRTCTFTCTFLPLPLLLLFPKTERRLNTKAPRHKGQREEDEK